MLSLRATTAGFQVPIGGAGAITDALVAELTAAGGQLRLGAKVERIRVEAGCAVGVVLADGEEIPCRAVVADVSAPALYLHLLEPRWVPGWIRRYMQRYPQGWGAFKVDFALDAPVPWTAEPARRAAVVHAGDDLLDLTRFTDQVRAGNLPDHPYLVIGQQSLVDPSRAPAGRHTLYVYTRVPAAVRGGWPAATGPLADRIVDRIEELAPGFRQTVLARATHTPDDLQAMSANLVGGDLGGGSNQWWRQAFFRPIFPYFRYGTPVKGVWLGSMYTHPGTGIHGMCGWNAAGRALGAFL
jgi:phytoene dehydrogenase-like protein